MENITSSKELLKGIQELALLSIEDIKKQMKDIDTQIEMMVKDRTAWNIKGLEFTDLASKETTLSLMKSLLTLLTEVNLDEVENG